MRGETEKKLEGSVAAQVPKRRKKREPHVAGTHGCEPPPGALLTSTLARPEALAPEAKSARSFTVPLMDICKLDTPVVKRIPQSQQSAFATVWGRLLRDAVASKQLGDWSDVFIFPKCVLWSPVRGGKRLAKKGKFADVVRDRLKRWSTDREGLWKEVVQRSTRVREPPEPRKPSDKDRTESAAIAALRLGDVRKAL